MIMDKLAFLLPEITLIVLSLGLLTNSMVTYNGKRMVNKTMLIAGAILSVLFILKTQDGLYLNATFENNPTTKIIKFLLISGSLFSLLLISNAKTDQLKKYFDEYCFLLVLSLVGGMCVISSREFFSLILSVELLSIPLYIISGMGPHPSKSIEAATKLFLFGTLSTVCLIFSAVLFYSFSGSTYFIDINWASTDYLITLASIFLVITISFKCALYPFHFWVADTYESAPINMLPFLSTIPKIAIIGFLLFFFENLTLDLGNKVIIVVLFVSLVSIIFGSILTIRQDNLLRLLAYSGIPHVGIMLIGIMVPNNISSDFLVLYFTFYIFANVGLYVCLNSLPKANENYGLDKLNSLYKNSPLLAISISCFLLSLAGAPLLGGFWGKFNIALISYKVYGLFLPSLILISALISFYYYLRIIKAIFGDKRPSQSENINFSIVNKIIIVICVFITVLLGVHPNILAVLI